MRSRLTAFALLLALCPGSLAAASDSAPTAAATADAQDGKSRLIVPMQSGAFVVIRTESTQPSPGDAASTLVESEERANLIRRVFVDSRNELFFGYELLVERAAEARYFWVTVRALGEEYLRELQARPSFRGRRPHPGYNATAFPAAPQFLRDGDTFALDVFRNPRTGATIVDLIQVSLTDPTLRRAGSDEPPRDFAPEDVQLRVTNYKLRVNGETVYSSSGGCAGALVWFSMGDRGRFVFSLVERPGYDFKKVGSVRHNTVAFEWGGDKYEWESAQPVVGAGGAWNLWVLHDPDYRLDLFDPAPAAANAADKTFAQQTDKTVRRMKQGRTQAEYGPASSASSASSASQQAETSKRARRERVVIGAADGVDYLFPRQQK